MYEKLFKDQLSSALKTVEHLKQLSSEENQSPKAIRSISKLLRLQSESLNSLQMIDPHNETIAEAIKEIDSRMTRFSA